MKLSWTELSIVFKMLCTSTVTGGKSSDGIMTVDFLNDAMYDKPELCLIKVTLYAYCMPRMSRRQEMNFDNEEKAMQGVRKCLQEEVRFINQSRVE